MRELLELEHVDATVFRGKQPTIDKHQVFGGQAIAQSLMAASRTVAEDRHVHSLHAYFLLRGNPLVPIVFLVDEVRDGSSYSTRTVRARQNGSDIFVLSASFHVAEEGGPEHEFLDWGGTRGTFSIDDVPRPEDLQPMDQVAPFRHPLDVRRVPPSEIDTAHATGLVWIRASEPLPPHPNLHSGVVAYSSDLLMLSTSLLPHGLRPGTPDVLIASIDHSMWFHRQAQADEWLLHHVQSPFAGNGRGFTRGQILDQSGRLIASTAQEGVVRRPRPKP